MITAVLFGVGLYLVTPRRKVSMVIKLKELNADTRAPIQASAIDRQHFCPLGNHLYTCNAVSCNQPYEKSCGHCTRWAADSRPVRTNVIAGDPKRGLL